MPDAATSNTAPDAAPTVVGANAALIEAARLLLSRMGLRPEDLLDGAPPPPSRPVMPTVADYIEVLMKAEPPGFRVYRTYWRRIKAKLGDKRLDEVKPSDITTFITQMKKDSVVRSRKGYRNGHSAHLHAVSAFRSLYQHAQHDLGLFTDDTNPAMKVNKPPQLPSSRQAIPDTVLAQINEVVASTGNDPELDALVLRLHVETGCRVGGVLALRASDLDPEQCLILLREKRNTERWQPVSPTLMRHLLAHAENRGGAADPDGPLLRYRSGKPMGQARYRNIWKRVRAAVPWAARRNVTAHWLRHTTITWVERTYGAAIAAAYAGHLPRGGSAATTTSLYTKATLGEIATALSALTREPHPLADAADEVFTEAIAGSVTTHRSRCRSRFRDGDGGGVRCPGRRHGRPPGGHA
ncbi:hypothetical protein BJF78_35590 [Pseudonocardia sp. CNS-139]|nr:hypothetical protein BJF78_35590 [Pseudonocardia sp. CNS-139]